MTHLFHKIDQAVVLEEMKLHKYSNRTESTSTLIEHTAVNLIEQPCSLIDFCF